MSTQRWTDDSSTRMKRVGFWMTDKKFRRLNFGEFVKICRSVTELASPSRPRVHVQTDPSATHLRLKSQSFLGLALPDTQ